MLELFQVENPEVLVIAIGVLLFVIVFSVLQKMKVFGRRGKGISILVSLIIAVMGTWYFYKEDFFGWEVSLGVVLVLVVVALFLRILWAFVKSGKRNLGFG